MTCKEFAEILQLDPAAQTRALLVAVVKHQQRCCKCCELLKSGFGYRIQSREHAEQLLDRANDVLQDPEAIDELLDKGKP